MEANTNVVIGTVCCSFVTFQLLFHFISCWFSARVSLGYNSLSTEKKIEWNSRVVSTCHSMLVGIFGLYLFFFDEATIADPLWGDPSLVKINISTASGYLISDLLIILFNWKVIGDKFFYNSPLRRTNCILLCIENWSACIHCQFPPAC